MLLGSRIGTADGTLIFDCISVASKVIICVDMGSGDVTLGAYLSRYLDKRGRIKSELGDMRPQPTAEPEQQLAHSQ